MGPRNKAAIEKSWAADIDFQLYAKEELRKQGITQLHILTEIRKLSALIESGLGEAHGALEAIRGDINALQRQSSEHEARLARR